MRRMRALFSIGSGPESQLISQQVRLINRLASPDVLLRQRDFAIRTLFLSLLALSLSLPLYAQTNNLGQALVEDEALRTPPTAQTNALAGQPALSLQPSLIAPKGAETTFFTFRRARLSGYDVIDESKLMRYWPYKPGEEASVADIFTFAAQITQHYREAGYALSFALVPVQDIVSGDFEIVIIEGLINALVLEGDPLDEEQQAIITTKFNRLQQRGPTKTADLERFLLRLNDLPGLSARGVIAPGDTPGTSQLILNMTEDRLDSSITYQNYLSENLGGNVIALETNGQHLFRPMDRLSVTARSAPDINVYSSLSADYTSYMPALDTSLRLGFSESSTKPKKGNLKALDFSSAAYSWTADINYPLTRTRLLNINIGSSFALSDSMAYQGSLQTSLDRTRTLTAYADYSFTPSLLQQFSLRAELEKGLSVMGSHANSREGASTGHSLLRLTSQYRGPLRQFEGQEISLQTRFQTQMAFGTKSLFAGAECSFGGRSFGIGFEAGSFSGDHCLMGSVQLNWRTNLFLFSAAPDGIGSLILRLDGGAIRQKGPLIAGEKRQEKMASYALGAQMLLRQGLSLSMENATILEHPSEPEKEGASTAYLSMNMVW